jgi:hypothetical protein
MAIKRHFAFAQSIPEICKQDPGAAFPAYNGAVFHDSGEPWR